MKTALVLAGGGTRGSYQNGALHALRRIGKDHFDIVTGTSIGTLNAAMIVQKDYAALDQLWHSLIQSDIIDGEISVDMSLTDMISERSQMKSFLKEFIANKGADVTPLKNQIHRLYRPDAFFASTTDFGCIACKENKEPVYVTKEMMREHGEEWLLASASAYPAFPVCTIDGENYMDGGYFDNCPVDYALRLGAEECIILDLNDEPHHPNYFYRPNMTYIFPHETTGSFLSFDREIINHLEILGYNDTMKAFGIFDGVKYTFNPMELPKWFDAYQIELMKLETKIKLATTVNEKIRSSQFIVDRLCEQQYQKVLNPKQIFFGLMDNCMNMCHMDSEKVYNYKDARNAILAEFAESAKEDYPYLPGIRPDEWIEYVKSLGQKGIIEKIVHADLYAGHVLFPENIVLTVFPFEKAMADFIVCMMMELKGE